MSFIEMTNAEWDEVRRHHDELVHMAELELQVERSHEVTREVDPSQFLKPVEIQREVHEG